MHNRTKLFYLDTNCLIDSRQYIDCVEKKVNEDHYTRGIKQGEKISSALEIARSLPRQIRVETSRLAEYEMRKRYHGWIGVQMLYEKGLPAYGKSVEEIYGLVKNPQHTLHTEYAARIIESDKWLSDYWQYRDVVQGITLDKDTFICAEPMPFISSKIQLADSLHLAHALAIGADYFVTADEKLYDAAKEITTYFTNLKKLPNEVNFNGETSVLRPAEFYHEVKTIQDNDPFPN